MAIFVYYDDYDDMGGTGMEEVKNLLDAEQFILQRMSEVEKPDIKKYKVIEGNVLTLTPVEYVTKININR